MKKKRLLLCVVENDFWLKNLENCGLVYISVKLRIVMD